MRYGRSLSIKAAEWLRERLWPDFVALDGCVYVKFQVAASPNKPDGSLTEWELFVNHTHIFDEFRTKAYEEVPVDQSGSELTEVEARYDQNHPEFLRAKQLGETMARMWATKLKQDFPGERFRVYYLHYDDACLRFHKVRQNEGVWLLDEQFIENPQKCFEDGILYDTNYLHSPVRRLDSSLPSPADPFVTISPGNTIQ
jgi:hypothetical protein